MTEACIIIGMGGQCEDPPGKMRAASKVVPPQCLSTRILLTDLEGARSGGMRCP